MPAVQHITMVANRRCVTVCRYCDLPLRPAGQPEGAYSWVVVQADGRIVRHGWVEDMTSAREAALDALAEVRG